MVAIWYVDDNKCFIGKHLLSSTYHMATILSNMNTLSQKLTEEYVLQAVRHILSIFEHYFQYYANTGPRNAVGNVSGYRCVSDRYNCNCLGV